MILTEKNGLRILTPKSNRYIIRIKNTNVYKEKIYLSKSANIDNFEEVEKITLETNDNIIMLAEEINSLNNFFSEVQNIINE